MSVELREIVLIPWLELFQMIILKGRKEESKKRGWEKTSVGIAIRINRKVIFRFKELPKSF